MCDAGDGSTLRPGSLTWKGHPGVECTEVMELLRSFDWIQEGQAEL